MEVLGLFRLEGSNLWIAVLVATALCAALLIPYLIEEIRRGKVDLGPRIPLGAGDTRPGYRGNPLPGREAAPVPRQDETLSLRSFHLVFIVLSILVASGIGIWATLHHDAVLGMLSFSLAVLLVAYLVYFAREV